jgi:tripartite ATP-independent transporter DctM subunit
VAGILPGIIMGLGLMSIWYFIALNRKFPVSKQRIRVIEIGEGFIKSFPAMFMPVVVIGGIVWGIFTPTEAAAVAFFYVVVCGFLVTRKLRLKHIQSALIRSASITAVTYLLLGTSGVISWEFTILHIPEKAAALFMEISSSPIVFLLLVNVFLLVLGMLIEPIPAMILLVPILHPIAVSYGINPVHFGIIVVLNLVIGLLTPPVGPCLFIDCAIAQISLERGTRAVAPFLIMLIVILFLLTYIPYLVLWLPGKFNLL